MYPMSGDAAGASGEVNAFTPSPNVRPIPADMEPQAPVANAFGNPQPQPAMPYYPPPMRTPMPPPMPTQTAQQQAPVAAVPVGSVRPTGAVERSAPSGDPLVSQATSMLRDSIYPSEREWAIERLSACDYRQDERILVAVRTATREDPAPTVRRTGLQALARMKVRTADVLEVVRGLTADPDENVRKEAEYTLRVLQTPAPR
jgi:hypothetical protein